MAKVKAKKVAAPGTKVGQRTKALAPAAAPAQRQRRFELGMRTDVPLTQVYGSHEFLTDYEALRDKRIAHVVANHIEQPAQDKREAFADLELLGMLMIAFCGSHLPEPKTSPPAIGRKTKKHVQQRNLLENLALAWVSLARSRLRGRPKTHSDNLARQALLVLRSPEADRYLAIEKIGLLATAKADIGETELNYVRHILRGNAFVGLTPKPGDLTAAITIAFLREQFALVRAGKNGVRLMVARLAVASGALGFKRCDPSETAEFTKRARKACDALVDYTAT
jgi:hypothetical protein